MHIGKVVIAGAGPGDPELLTLKTARYLHEADVVLTDRLVSRRILELYVNPIAEIIFTGKEGGKKSSTPQETINELLVKHARDGKLVVRLKGGDISVFSNILDELETLRANNIPYELIPGITAAAGAAASAGIPLTAREHAAGVRFLSGSRKEPYNEWHWQELANTSDTLVFYMAGDLLPVVVNELLLHNIDSGKELALIQQATTSSQKVFTYSFAELRKGVVFPAFVSPSLVIVGHVVKLHRQFAWLKDSSGFEKYFPPIERSTAATAVTI